MKEKIMVFIDGENVNKASQTQNFKVDYLKLVEALRNNRDNRRTYYFDSVKKEPKKYNAKLGFLDALRRHGITVYTKNLRKKIIRCEDCPIGKEIKKQKELFLPDSKLIKPYYIEYQKGVDIAIVTELFKMARENAFETAIIVSGDDDFASAVACVKDMGKRVEVASFKKSLGYDMREIADKLIILDDFKKSVKLKKKK